MFSINSLYAQKDSLNVSTNNESYKRVYILDVGLGIGFTGIQKNGSSSWYDHTQWQKQLRLIRYINQREYLTHHDPEVILRCERIRRQFTMISAICGIVIASLLMMIIWP